MSKNNIVKAAGLLLVINIGVKLLGFVREMVIANGFGASFASDAYLVAYTIPYFLQTILGYAFVSAVLPLLSACWKEEGDNEEAYRLGSSLINLTLIVMTALAVLGVLAAPALVWLTAPALDADTYSLSVELTRILFPSLIFMSAGMVIAGILNSRYRFVAAAVAPGVTALFVIVSTAWFAKGNIYVVAIGTLLGFVGFFLVQAADLPRTGFRYRLVCDYRHPQIRQVMRDLLPIIIGLAVNQFYIIINRIFASGMQEGSISALNYANKLINLPLGLFVAAVITAVFPTLAELAQKQDKQELAATVSRGVSLSLLVVLPASVGLMLLDGEIVRLLFEGGNFNAQDTLITAQALFAMAPGMLFIGGSMLLCRVCYALHDVRTPLLCTAISVAVNLLLCWLLAPHLAHIGLAWANTFAAGVNTLLLGWHLQRQLPFLDADFRDTLGKSLSAVAVMGLVVFVLTQLWPAARTKLSLLLMVGAIILIAIVVYLAVLWLLKSRALHYVLDDLLKK